LILEDLLRKKKKGSKRGVRYVLGQSIVLVEGKERERGFLVL
jgi:hypothetical protein